MGVKLTFKKNEKDSAFGCPQSLIFGYPITIKIMHLLIVFYAIDKVFTTTHINAMNKQAQFSEFFYFFTQIRFTLWYKKLSYLCVKIICFSVYHYIGTLSSNSILFVASWF